MFIDVTEEEQVEWLKGYILQNSSTLNLCLKRVDLLAHGTSTVFKATTLNRQQFVLKVVDELEVNFESLKRVLYWLYEVSESTEIKIPKIIKIQDKVCLKISDKLIGNRLLYFLEYLPKAKVFNKKNIEDFFVIGKLLASFHNLTPPKHILELFKCDYSFHTFGEMIFSKYNLENIKKKGTLPKELQSALEISANTIRKFSISHNLSGNKKCILHGDPIISNFIISNHDLFLIDLDNIGMGEIEYDIAIFLFSIDSEKDYIKMRCAFISGYNKISALPVKESLIDVAICAHCIRLILSVVNRQDHPGLRIRAPHIILRLYKRLIRETNLLFKRDLL